VIVPPVDVATVLPAPGTNTRKVPETSSLYVGAVDVPIPIFPVGVKRIFPVEETFEVIICVADTVDPVAAVNRIVVVKRSDPVALLKFNVVTVVEAAESVPVIESPVPVAPRKLMLEA
jgi:hypothetical protein